MTAREPIPPLVRQGDSVSAAWLNRVRDAAVRAGNLVAGPGITIASSPAGTTIAADHGFNPQMWGVVKAVHIAGVAAPETAPDAPAQDVTYDVQYDGLSIGTLNVRPVLLRPAEGAVRIVPARVGDPCFSRLIADGAGGFVGHACMPTERLAFGACAEAPGAAPLPPPVPFWNHSGGDV